jgi:hypothetical protein
MTGMLAVMKVRLTTVIGLAALLLLAGTCGDDDEDGPGVPNPAAVFCEEQGGTVSGPEPMCELPDGTVVDAWEYYRTETENDAGLANPARSRAGPTRCPSPSASYRMARWSTRGSTSAKRASKSSSKASGNWQL